MAADRGPSFFARRDELRKHLLAQRTQFAAAAGAAAAAAALGLELRAILGQLEPGCLGLYWPHRAEFNAPAALADDEGLAKSPFALPFALRSPPSMHYRLWDRSAPRTQDECGIAASDGPPADPDVVLVPCVGYTASGFRLGYGGGYFDRWLAAHAQVCAIGVAWADARMEEADFDAAPHDVRLALIVTERGVN